MTGSISFSTSSSRSGFIVTNSTISMSGSVSYSEEPEYTVIHRESYNFEPAKIINNAYFLFHNSLLFFIVIENFLYSLDYVLYIVVS